MEIKPIKRPWQPQHKQGKRHNPDPFYQSREWKFIKQSFINSAPLIKLEPIHGIEFKNDYCVECWKEGKIVKMYALDHIQRRRDGGSDEHENLQGLCKKHHASKSAEEANETKK